MKSVDDTKKATVVGLGLMGATLAKLLIESGYQVTVWNRSAEKAERLVSEGAFFASSVRQAIEASPLIVVCVHDYQATKEIFSETGAEAALAGKSIVQLSTGSPAEARESEAWANKAGAGYLDGAILAVPVQMGRPETTILASGREDVFRRAEQVLGIFGGKINYLGAQVSLASAMDLAVLSYMYGATLGFFHGARIGEVEGFRADAFGELLADLSPTIGELVKFEAGVIQKGDFTAVESSIGISIEAVERILRTAREAGINTAFPRFAASILRQAGEAGYAKEEFGALIKIFRRPDTAETAAGGKNV